MAFTKSVQAARARARIGGVQILANQRREKFAQLVASGASSHAEAYRSVYSKSPKASQANAARLMANDSIAARIEELRAMSAAVMADARLAGELVGKSEVENKGRILTPERRNELLRMSIERRQAERN